MKFLDYLKPNKDVSAGEDLADSIVLIVIMLILFFVAFK